MYTRSLSLALLSMVAAFDASGNDNVVVYWGQNSAGGDNTQQRLSYYCQQDSTDVLVLSFLNKFYSTGGYPSDNFGNACSGTMVDGTSLLDCTSIADDIKTCQSLGKKVLLSLGGQASTAEVGFTSASEAQSFADELWDIFGNVPSNSIRPFGDSVVDGFDLDIESGSSDYYSDFVTEMRKNYATDSGKTYYISAAPQCPIPDSHLNDAIVNSDIDFLFVQFYNNDCGIQNYGDSSFNFAAWDQLAKDQSYNKNIKVYLGVPGSSTASSSGYQSASTVASLAQDLQKKYTSFGGVSIWDASQAWTNDDFAAPIKQALLADASSTTTTTTSSSTSTTSSSSTTTSSAVTTSSSSTSSTSTSTSSTVSSTSSSSLSTESSTSSSSLSTESSTSSTSSSTDSSVFTSTSSPVSTSFTPSSNVTTSAPESSARVASISSTSSISSTEIINSTATVTTKVSTSAETADAGESTTRTIESTSVETITSCAPTVTDCPLRAHNGTAYITHVNTITVVECPASTYTLGPSPVATASHSAGESAGASSGHAAEESSAPSSTSHAAEKSSAPGSPGHAAEKSSVPSSTSHAAEKTSAPVALDHVVEKTSAPAGSSHFTEKTSAASSSPSASETSSPATPVEETTTPAAPVEETSVPTVPVESNGASIVGAFGATVLFAIALLL